MKLITETNFDISKVINESEDGKKELFIEGIFATAEKINRNGRKYPRNILEREINNISMKINEDRLLGELNHPTDRTEIDLKEAAIKITSLNWQNNDVCGKARVLNTPNGKILEALLEANYRTGISSRGLGTVSEGIVNEDLQLITWDVVDNPSNINSFVNGILEGVDFKTEEQKVDEIQELMEQINHLKEENDELKTKLSKLKTEFRTNYIIEKILNS